MFLEETIEEKFGRPPQKWVGNINRELCFQGASLISFPLELTVLWLHPQKIK